MATLTGTKIKDTYDGLLKAKDNDAIGVNKKVITDGLGNETPLEISTSEVKVNSPIEAQGFVKTGAGPGEFLKADGTSEVVSVEAPSLDAVTDVGNTTINSVEVGDITARDAFIKASAQELGLALEVNDTSVSTEENIPFPYVGMTFDPNNNGMLISYFTQTGPLPSDDYFLNKEFTFTVSDGTFKATCTSAVRYTSEVYFVFDAFVAENSDLYAFINANGPQDFGWEFGTFAYIPGAIISNVKSGGTTPSSEIKVDGQLSDIDTSKSYFVSNSSTDFDFGGPVSYPNYPNDYFGSLYNNMWNTLTTYGTDAYINTIGQTFYWVFNNNAMPTPTPEVATDNIIYFKFSQYSMPYEMTLKVTNVNYIGSYKEVFFEVVDYSGMGSFNLSAFKQNVANSVITSSPVVSGLKLQPVSFSESNGELILEFDNTDPVGMLSAGETIYVAQSENKLDFVKPSGESTNIASYDFVSDTVSLNTPTPYVTKDNNDNTITTDTELNGNNFGAVVLGEGNILNGNSSLNLSGRGNILIGSTLSAPLPTKKSIIIGGNNTGSRYTEKTTMIGFDHDLGSSYTSASQRINGNVIVGANNRNHPALNWSNSYSTDSNMSSVAVGQSSKIAGKGAVAIGAYSSSLDSGAITINSNGHARYELGGYKTDSTTIPSDTYATLYKSIDTSNVFKQHATVTTYANYNEGNGSIYFGINRFRDSVSLSSDSAVVVKIDGVLKTNATPNHIHLVDANYILKWNGSSWNTQLVTQGNSTYELFIGTASSFSYPYYGLHAFYVTIKNNSGTSQTFESFAGTVDVYHV